MITEDTSREGGANVSPFSVALVCGNAFCLHEDIAIARGMYPDAPIMAVNGASGAVKAQFLFSKHPERFVEPHFEWSAVQRQKFGDGFTVHGSTKQSDMPWVDRWWPKAKGGGGSAWGARKVLALMGFKKVVLCGAPLLPGNYSDYNPGKLMTDERVIEQFHREIIAEPEWHKGAVSMSGWTKDFLACHQ